MLTAGLPELTSMKDIQYLKVSHTHAVDEFRLCALCMSAVVAALFLPAKSENERGYGGKVSKCNY